MILEAAVCGAVEMYSIILSGALDIVVTDKISHIHDELHRARIYCMAALLDYLDLGIPGIKHKSCSLL